jgi:aspartate/methionine/tyrosine aminotransferase
MPIPPFKLERYFAQYEFKLKYLLSPSDCESLSMDELLQLASPESLALWQGLRLGYTESQGHPRLRSEIAGMYQHIRPGNVILAAPEEAIFIAMHTLLEPGDQVVALSPVYQSLHELARSIGCEVISWTLQPGADNGWHLDFAQLEGSLTDHTRLLVINFPHNPTGHTLTPLELDEVIRLARKHNLILFSDEMYRLLEYDPSTQLSPVCDLYEKGISLSGLSKSFALPGLRLGWLASQEGAFLERWLAFKDYTTICSNASGEVLAMIALRNRKRIIDRHLARIERNLRLLDAFFIEFQDRFAWVKPKAGTIAFPRLHGGNSALEFCQQVVRQANVMLLPSTVYDYDDRHFRLGFGRENLPEALEQLSAYLKHR